MEEKISEVKKEENEEVKQEKKDLIQKANEAAERLEKANNELKELLLKQENIMVNARLGGKSFGGITPPIKTAEDKLIEESMNFLKGTGLDPFKHAKRASS